MTSFDSKLYRPIIEYLQWKSESYNQGTLPSLLGRLSSCNRKIFENDLSKYGNNHNWIQEYAVPLLMNPYPKENELTSTNLTFCFNEFIVSPSRVYICVTHHKRMKLSLTSILADCENVPLTIPKEFANASVLKVQYVHYEKTTMYVHIQLIHVGETVRVAKQETHFNKSDNLFTNGWVFKIKPQTFLEKFAKEKINIYLVRSGSAYHNEVRINIHRDTDLTTSGIEQVKKMIATISLQDDISLIKNRNLNDLPLYEKLGEKSGFVFFSSDLKRSQKTCSEIALSN
jgi:hypothetical protein